MADLAAALNPTETMNNNPSIAMLQKPMQAGHHISQIPFFKN